MKSLAKTAIEFDYIMQEITEITKNDTVVKEIVERAEHTARTTTMSLPQAMSLEANKYFNEHFDIKAKE